MERKLVNLLELAHVIQLLEQFSSRRIVDQALHTAGLDRAMLEGVSGFIPYAAEAILIESVARAINDRHLGARIGKNFQYSSYGAYAHFVLAAPNLATALERGRRALLLIHPGSEIVQRQTDTHLVVGRNSNGLSVTGHHHLDEGALFVIGHVARHFLGSDWKPDWVELPNVRGRDATELEDLVGAPVRVGAVIPSIAIRLTDLTALNPAPPKPDQSISLNELEGLMGIAPAQTMEDAVVQVLSITFATHLTNETAVAKLLCIGVRSLQRALKDEGTTFRKVRAQVVSHRAASLLVETDTPLDQIALILGYSDPRSFRRSFKSSLGLSPSAFRETKKVE
ncbi:helix-turn-helix domain-containing protein [Falsihalocynthiibacter sp. S25ZX9]|uniref:helix-turn-helix domain-containing protein n=1 Tax=Falsihalocynthiibacter sp. S25ZX9 TaxID=3240870 RepID=UPI00350EE488